MPKRKPTKVKPKANIALVEKKISPLDPLVPTRTCYVCDRESRTLLMVGPSKFRHSDCYPGSPNWIEYITNMREHARTEEQTILHNFFTQQGK